MPSSALRTWSPLVERAGVALLLLAALVPRVREQERPFDRSSDGFQGGYFSIAAVNYERLGPGAAGGYPVLNIEVDAESPETWFVYSNHPPTVGLLAWAGAKALGPAGWADEWGAGRAPEGLELAVRAPFLLLHLLGLFALWWAVRQGGSARRALLALAIAAVLPVSALYAGLVNYENASLPWVLLAYGFAARWVRAPAGRRRRELALVALCFAAAGATTYAPAFFVPPLVLSRLMARRPGDALRVGLAAGAAVLAPLLLHAAWARPVIEGLGQEPLGLGQRASSLAAPLLSGEAWGRWLEGQARFVDTLISWPVAVAALAGLCLAVPRSLRRATREGPNLELCLALGGGLVMLGYFGHTADQDTFLLNIAPGICALAAVLLDALAGPLYRLRGGAAPLVVATSLVALPALARFEEVRRTTRAPGPLDPGGGPGPEVRLPASQGPLIAEALPPGAAALYPGSMGYSMATFYYAWRTLLPVADEASAALAAEHLATHGMDAAPLFMLLPRDPPGSARPGVDRVRALFQVLRPELAGEPPDIATEHFEGWLLNGT